MLHRVIKNASLSSPRKGPWLNHIWWKLGRRSLTVKTGMQSHLTGNRIRVDQVITFQKSRYNEPGQLWIRFEEPEQRALVDVPCPTCGTNCVKKEWKVVRPKRWHSIGLRDSEVKLLIDFLAGSDQAWHAPRAKSSDQEFVTYEELISDEEETA